MSPELQHQNLDQSVQSLNKRVSWHFCHCRLLGPSGPECRDWLLTMNWILVNILKLGLVKILMLDLVEMLIFGWYFEVNAQSRFWNFNMFKICELWSCNMNSTLGSVVPLAMFLYFFLVNHLSFLLLMISHVTVSYRWLFVNWIMV